MKKYLILMVAALVALPGLGLSDTFSIRAGYFFPRAGSDLWTTEFQNLSLTRSDYQAAVFGASYELFLNSYVSAVLSVDTYSKMKSGFYKDWVGYSFPEGDFAYPASEFQGQFSLIQTFSVSMLPIQASVRFTPLGRRGGFIPYLGGGVALNIWNVRMYGDMVDFSQASADPTYPDVTRYPDLLVDIRENNKLAIGYQGFAGVMVPVGTRMTIEGEFKYSYSKHELENFQGFKPFDMSGFQLTVGLNYWF